MILPKAELTPSGRPKLVAGEVERVLLDKVIVIQSVLLSVSGLACGADHVTPDTRIAAGGHRV
jgi:hypothetical protein